MSLARRAEFFLNRHVKAAEAKVEVDHVGEAEKRTSYSDRIKKEGVADSAQNEAEALRWLLGKVQVMPDQEP